MNHSTELEETAYQRYADASFRKYIEDRFYRRIAEKARIEHLKSDKSFLADPVNHIGLYSDHGPVHVKDVAQQLMQVIVRVNGVLFPERKGLDLELMKQMAVHLAYMHDIGMVDFSEYGRFMHPEFAAQFVFSQEFAGLFNDLWQKNSGGFRTNLEKYLAGTGWKGSEKHVAKELLSLAVAHSKSKVPVGYLNRPVEFSALMQNITTTPLPVLYHQQKIEKLKGKLLKKTGTEESLQKQLKNHEKELEQALSKVSGYNSDKKLYEIGKARSEQYGWMTDQQLPMKKFTGMVIDVLRCLRAADALRQRGTTLRTSAGYEVLVDGKSAQAIYALRSLDQQKLTLLKSKKALNAGEANISSSELDYDGNLRIAFHRGNFSTKTIEKRAASYLAVVIEDIQADVLQSFIREDGPEPVVEKANNMAICIEKTPENPKFANRVKTELENSNPALRGRISETSSLKNADLEEVKKYLDGKPVKELYPRQEINNILRKLNQSGLYVETSDHEHLLSGVKEIQVEAHETLIRGESPSGFVYLPLEEGLIIEPLGGYPCHRAPALVLLGTSGVIRGSVRNAEVRAEQGLKIWAIPRDVYLYFWYKPLSPTYLRKKWRKENRSTLR